MKQFFLSFLIVIFAMVLSGCTKKEVLSPSPSAESVACDDEKGCLVSPNSVPLATSEDAVRTFLGLIAEKKIPEAVGILSANASPDEASKQMWGVNFNSIKKLTIKNIEGSEDTFKVTLDLEVNNPGEYNWENGENLRWITVSKNPNNDWKIDSIATGP